MNTAEIMNKFYTNDLVRSNISLVFNLSFPFWKKENAPALASLIYKTSLYDASVTECAGYLYCGNQLDDKIKFNLVPLEPIAVEFTPFSLIQRRDLYLGSKEAFEAVRNEIYMCLDEIRGCLLCNPGHLSIVQKNAVKDYLELLCTMVSPKLLGCYYAAEPDFFDWCGSVIIENN